ncbi:CCA tRNA nucleotidyltransferase [Caproiciproducens galactitolivorans]|uniref:CCA tRNA nucleotidyltransferase n=1 Tax=Caproiciproducens galactitolivorans TaxID=642589 RepID=A0ABT4BQU2_9FIRM|nr:CCA tRNA nucleotidyltransferase [Caproiciproducens galactitolivorans]MCY1713204.1 CCA tRNA nucleotidyltransferase [Caproiciproducens galactitolivorans]
MKINLPPQVEKAIETLNNSGFEAYVVGGCVRDTLMGKQPFDWDVTTSAMPEEIKNAFTGYKRIETGIKHGTITVLIGQMPIEVTAYRIDGEYSDSRHPDSVRFTRKLEEDLARRDFTMNALAYHPANGLIDCFEGLKDIKLRRIRCVGDPDLRFQEDGLRILRALRFSSVLDFEIEKETSESIHRNCGRLRLISAERINTEFTKLICGRNAEEILRDYRFTIEQFLPEIAPLAALQTESGQNVWEHTLRAITAAEAVPVLRLTMLLHEIGKPFYDNQNKANPDLKGAEIANQALKKLRYDGWTVRTISELVKRHNLPLIPEEKQILRYLNRFGAENFRLLLKVKEADAKAQLPVDSKTLEDLEKADRMLEYILKSGLCYSLKGLAVSGADLMKLGIPEGAEVGKTLTFLLNAVMDGKCPNEHSELIKYIKKEGTFNGNG